MSGLTMSLMAIGVAAALALGVARVGEAAIDDARAASAADAAALAGAAAGPAASERAAQRNGGTLISVKVRGAITSVVVQVGIATAEAHAERLLVPE